MDSRWSESRHRARKGLHRTFRPTEIYFAVENADQIPPKAKDVGGSVIIEAVDVFDAGRRAVIQDTQGAVFAD